MTILVQFENNNWYAEGVAVMEDWLFDHPLMRDTLDAIAMETSFDFVSEFEREVDFRVFFNGLMKLVDDLHHFVPQTAHHET